MTSTQVYPLVTKKLASHFTSRIEAFRNTYLGDEPILLSLYVVDQLLQHNDIELLIEVICIMLDWQNLGESFSPQIIGQDAEYTAIIERLVINTCN